jgi:hypothetical protein
MDSDSDDDSIIAVESVFTPDEFMFMGLEALYTNKHRRLQRAGKKQNTKRFRKHFGVKPVVCARIWEDLQTVKCSDVDNDGIVLLPVQENKLQPRYFLMALHHLKRYPTEDEREAVWDVSAKTGRQWVRFFLSRLQALKIAKVVWPEDWGNDDVWVITVDGTHVWIEEPIHPDWSQDSKYFSHKFGKAGINYELGIAIATSRLVWMNGPFKAGTNDVKIFSLFGLKDLLLSYGKKAIGDKGYTGHTEVVSFFNKMDSRPVKKFKSRALKRHETFNGLTKRYRVLRGPFRHGVDAFATSFEAVCVLCQYQIEDEPLFDVLIDDVLCEDERRPLQVS